MDGQSPLSNPIADAVILPVHASPSKDELAANPSQSTVGACSSIIFNYANQ